MHMTEANLDRRIAFEREKWREAQRRPRVFSKDDWCAGPGIYETPFPFRLMTWEGGWSWHPGPTPLDDSGPQIAHGIGLQIMEVISFHKPASQYHVRVFYRRRWRDPDGKEFARSGNGLLINTLGKVNRMIAGPAADSYVLRAPPAGSGRPQGVLLAFPPKK